MPSRATRDLEKRIQMTLDYEAMKGRVAQLEAELAELKSAVGPLIPPWFHESVPPSREIYSAFVSGGFVTRYTVDQAKRAQKAMEPHA